MTANDFDGKAWSLLSNHGHALICIYQQPDIRLWELAETIGIRERSAQRIVNQLVDAGYVTRHHHDHHGARVTYTVDRNHHLRRPHLNAYTVGDLLDTFNHRPNPPEEKNEVSRDDAAPATAGPGADDSTPAP
jgi:MarR family protein